MRHGRGRLRAQAKPSELFLPEPHPLKPGIGLLKAPAVIGFQNIGDGDHHIEGAAVVAAASDGGALQGCTQLQEIQFRKPVAMLKRGKGVVLLEGRERELVGLRLPGEWAASDRSASS